MTRRLLLDSPGGELFLDFAPDRHDGAWWTIAHHEPYWQVEFSRQTPIEAVAAVAQALPQLLGDHRHADRIPLATESVADIARRSDWAWQATATGGAWSSPDGHCTLAHTIDSTIPWTVEHSVYDGFDTHWTATFTRDAPERLIAQFVTHLADTAPVQRRFAEVPHLAVSSALITAASSGGVGSHTRHAVAELGRTLAATEGTGLPAARPRR
ncbi:DUF317 domain-containing protein [Streptomyces sp. NPDC055100]